ncbi:MAG: hypothetical protein WAW61_05715, partial [Methylococcaceae bacterium]
MQIESLRAKLSMPANIILKIHLHLDLFYPYKTKVILKSYPYSSGNLKPFILDSCHELFLMGKELINRSNYTDCLPSVANGSLLMTG